MYPELQINYMTLRNICNANGCSFSETGTSAPGQVGCTSHPGPWRPWGLQSYTAGRQLRAPLPLVSSSALCLVTFFVYTPGVEMQRGGLLLLALEMLCQFLLAQTNPVPSLKHA